MQNAKCKNQNEGKPTETSKALEDLFYRYTHLPLGGKEIVCPYWMNNLKEGIYGPFGGKGLPEQIVQATQDAARQRERNLTTMSEQEILDFMKQERIGIDCSGFVFWMLDCLDREKGGDGIASDIPGCKGKVLECRANVEMLTSENVALSILKVAEVKVGDMIRLGQGTHVAIVMRVRRVGKIGRITQIEYGHSSARTKILGVHAAKIRIVDERKGLEAQKWEEMDKNGQNYGQTNLFPTAGDGLKRLKIGA